MHVVVESTAVIMHCISSFRSAERAAPLSANRLIVVSDCVQKALHILLPSALCML
jgi:hypothetical protein